MHGSRMMVVAALLLALLSGCTTTLYRANAVNAALLREQGEFKGSLSSSDLQLAYAPARGFGLMANGHYEDLRVNQRKASGWLAEAGAGTFGKVLIENLLWEAYGGAGFGQSIADDTLESGARPVHYDASGVRFFVQPSVGYVTPYFELAASARFSGVKYVSLNVSGYSDAERTQQFLEADPVLRPFWLFFEPAFTFRAGYKWVKLYVQRGWTLKLNGEALPYPTDQITVGLTIDVASWYHDFHW